jgi:hypothetical protein
METRLIEFIQCPLITPRDAIYLLSLCPGTKSEETILSLV